jgi:hypothetical protein
MYNNHFLVNFGQRISGQDKFGNQRNHINHINHSSDNYDCEITEIILISRITVPTKKHFEASNSKKYFILLYLFVNY